MDKSITISVGMDVGDRVVELYVIDGQGDLVEQTRVPCTISGVRRKFTGLPRCRVALEMGAHSHRVSRELSELGHEVPVAEARRRRLICRNPH